ncbi:MAG: XRE family transcriptional regulator [Bacillota bacterium]
MNENVIKDNMEECVSDTSYVHVRSIRKKKGVSLKELSALSGLSISFLSNYENGKVNISVASLKKISAALDVSISQLLTDDDTSEVTLVHKRDRYILPHHMTKHGMAYTDYLMRGISTAMHVTVTRLPPHSDTGDNTAHTGEEYIYVLRGVATVIINDNKYLLQDGDMIYYASKFPHKVANEQDGELEYLQTNTPPSF